MLNAFKQNPQLSIEHYPHPPSLVFPWPWGHVHIDLSAFNSNGALQVEQTYGDEQV